MLPAFLDSHSHFSAAANATFQVPLEECVSHEEIKERIKRFIKEQNKEPGEWVLAKGYDHNLYEGPASPPWRFSTRRLPITLSFFSISQDILEC